ncbi:MAG: 2Fe-2S iron-sulfur cluster binding domain-containing protein [Gammaproteobacteria bacterium]|nr:2Fe-2S iron-sulfur cluster binding domain-containing protein [Gammaproteobacteria bacterium]
MAETIHHVTVLPSGKSFACTAQQSVLAAAHEANILISYSCRSGQCGSCMGKLLLGEIQYPAGLPDAISTAQAEAGYVLFCSAFATSDLTIELIEPEFAQD